MKSVVKRLAVPCAVALALAGVTMPFGMRAGADSIISTNTEQAQDKGPAGYGTGPGEPVGQQFTLNQGFTIGSIIITMQQQGDPSSDVSLGIYSSSGNNLGSLLYSDVSATGLSTPYNFGDVTFSFSGANLSAGTYWAALSDSGPNGVGWGQSVLNTGISNAAATIDNNVTVIDQYVSNFDLMMELDTPTPSAVPEPGSLLMVAVGGLMVVGLTAVEVRRRRVVTA